MFSTAVSLVLFATLTVAQLTGTVGPTTSTSSKGAKICSVLDYGGAVGSSVRVKPLSCSRVVQLNSSFPQDIGPAIGSAFTNCVLKNSASTLYVPPGSYSMATWQTLSGGSHWALQLDGVITRTGTVSCCCSTSFI